MNQGKLDVLSGIYWKPAGKEKAFRTDASVEVAGAARHVNHHLKLEYLQVTSGVGVRSVASLGLNISGEHFEAAATSCSCIAPNTVTKILK